MRQSFADYLGRTRYKYGDRFDPSGLPEKFVPYFESGQRIIVRTTYNNGETYTRRGYVGVTTGWRPSFLLVNNTRSMGSSDLLGPDDEIIGTVNRYR